jgi:hypothetical protein
MSTFWQTVLPATVTALVAGRVAVTRTGRLRVGEREAALRFLRAAPNQMRSPSERRR